MEVEKVRESQCVPNYDMFAFLKNTTEKVSVCKVVELCNITVFGYGYMSLCSSLYKVVDW